MQCIALHTHLLYLINSMTVYADRPKWRSNRPRGKD